MATAYLDRTLTISDAVQGVTEWQVEGRTDTGSGYGAYSIIGTYECPSAPIDEMEVYAFAYQEVITGFFVGDKIQRRFTPTGFDAGNGAAFESVEYDIEEAVSSISQQSCSVTVGCMV